MLEDIRPVSFRTAPVPVRRLVATVLEPAVAALLFLAMVARPAHVPERATFIVCLLVFALGVPGRDRFSLPAGRAARDIVGSWVGVGAILGLIGFAMGALQLAPASMLLAWIVFTPGAQWAAVRAGNALMQHRAHRPAREVVVIGSGPWGAHVASKLAGRRAARMRVAGFFDDRQDERLDAAARGHRLGGLKDAAAYVRDHRVAEVHITLPLYANPRIHDLLTQLQRTTASVFYVPDITGIGVVQGRLEDRDGLPLVGLCETPFTGTNLLVKRASDIVVASVALVLLLPVLLAVAAGVKLSGPGPVIFRQRRNGLGGEEIVVYKFRSMNTLDDGAVVRQATRGDPRLTRFGRFIRRTSLDELPQFVNVLQGRMSVVGPRPHAVAHNEYYRDVVRAYMVRHKVRPGITGWAQVNGCRGETDTLEKMQARVEYDLEYLRNWSLGLDLAIIARTVGVVFGDKQAY
jgi:putative colanic acid biosysnthesis UDP-glucose lipid carrier transferase